MNALRSYTNRTFASLVIHNYRLFFIGQSISMSGTWMQTVAQGLLVLKLTGSGTDLGLVTALQSLPVLFFGAWGGVIADRFPKRQILYATQAISGIASLLVGGLVLTNTVELWMVYLISALLGMVKVFDNPARQTFIREMVGNDHLTNAVSLNSMMVNLARVIGPTLAGIIVATVGLGLCFILDGLSYAVVIATIVMMRGSELHPAKLVARTKGQLADGFRYAWSEPLIRNTLIMMAIIGTFTYEFTVTLPLLAEFTFDMGSSGYAALTASMGIGAVIGGLYTASRKRSTPLMLVLSALGFGLAVLLTSVTPTFTLAVVGMLLIGFFSINFTSIGNVTIQLASSAGMQGRVMALWSIAFLGTTPIGGPIMGAIGEHMGARLALGIGGVAALIAAGVGMLAIRHDRAIALHATTAEPRRARSSPALADNAADDD